MNLPLHGANPLSLYSRLGVEIPDGLEVADFSTNTNVLEWDGDCDFDIRSLMSAYPDPESSEIREILADRNDCAPENIIVTNGSNEAIYILASIFAEGAASFADPTYGEYRRACAAYGLREADAESDGDLHFICNPCNPTGGYVDAPELEKMAKDHPNRCLVVDEAYVDFLRGPHSALPFKKYPNIVILRSLTKVFHLCGARIGYALASTEQIARMKERQPTWSVNSLAQEACKRFLEDRDFVERTKSFYAVETPRFIEGLKSCGLNVLPTRTNFFLIRVRDDERTIRELLREGIVVRHTRNFIGLDGGYIRVATRTPLENNRFCEAAEKLKRLYGESVF